MQHAFHLADHLADYATRTPELFAVYVTGQIHRHGTGEPVIWRLRGLGQAELPWRQVNRIIRDAVIAAGGLIVEAQFLSVPQPAEPTRSTS